MATYRGVVGATGLPGSGKSYFLVEKALEAQRRGIPVWSNAGFDVRGTRTINSFRDFVEIQGPAVVVFDELPLFFNARKWQTFPDGMLYKLTQIRKDRVELYYSAIHQRMVDAVLRMLTFEWVRCRIIAGRILQRVHEAPEEFGGHVYERRYSFIRKRVIEAYNTMGKVAVADASLPTKVSADPFVMPESSAEESDGGDPTGNRGEGGGGGSRLRVTPPPPGPAGNASDRSAG